ncbi:MAG: type I-C CRISPR-associated protein Cas7/Csd2 [Lactobacillales bacterium]|jgi:CRISPR-associated protein Csd2|nr:type I-C CRISPR-associated protein Cas7/Csd2 [Lactobacillales bacterium]
MSLTNKIDFAVIIGVKNANPNGDPLNGNRPRQNYDGLGEISDVAIKRKIRNRLQDLGQAIFVQSNDRSDDGQNSLSGRYKQFISSLDKGVKGDEVLLSKKLCENWLDVRSFGQVFAFSSKESKGISIGVRGPVSVQSAFSIEPIDIESIQITKSVNGEETEDGRKASDTMGMKHRVDKGFYVTYGSINTQLASKTDFSNEDAVLIKKSLSTLFENDESSARPAGSMWVEQVIWWEHDSAAGQYSSAKVHGSLTVEPDGVYTIKELEGLKYEECIK